MNDSVLSDHLFACGMPRLLQLCFIVAYATGHRVASRNQALNHQRSRRHARKLPGLSDGAGLANTVSASLAASAEAGAPVEAHSVPTSLLAGYLASSLTGAKALVAPDGRLVPAVPILLAFGALLPFCFLLCARAWVQGGEGKRAAAAKKHRLGPGLHAPAAAPASDEESSDGEAGPRSRSPRLSTKAGGGVVVKTVTFGGSDVINCRLGMESAESIESSRAGSASWDEGGLVVPARSERADSSASQVRGARSAAPSNLSAASWASEHSRMTTLVTQGGSSRRPNEVFAGANSELRLALQRTHARASGSRHLGTEADEAQSLS